jgi:hypothetical protein
VGVGVNDELQLEVVLLEDFDDLVDITAGIDDNGVAGLSAGEDRAIALEQAHREGFEEHGDS